MGRSCLMPSLCHRFITSFGIPYLSRTSVFTASNAGAPSADGAGETSALGYRAVETAGAENIVASHADHQAAVENQRLPAVAFFLSGKKVILHNPGHFGLPYFHNSLPHIDFQSAGLKGPGLSGPKVGSRGLPTHRLGLSQPPLYPLFRTQYSEHLCRCQGFF